MDQDTVINKVPFILVTGFLGSGKTSLLKHILQELGNNRRIAVVQNEFAPGKVDSVELQDTQVSFDLLEINNGSVFCACLLDDFICRLAEFIDLYHPEIIFLEATGLADPVSMAQILQSPEVESLLYLAGAWTVVDCLNFDKAHQYLKQVRHQIQIADIILLNKTDLAEPSEKLIYTIRQWNPFAKLYHSHKGLFNQLANELEKILVLPENHSGNSSLPIQDDEHGESDMVDSCLIPIGSPRPNIGSCVVRTNKIFSATNIKLFFAEHKEHIYRMKGYTKTVSGQFLAIQSIFDKLEITPIPNWWGPTELIIMGPDITPGPITKALFSYSMNPDKTI